VVDTPVEVVASGLGRLVHRSRSWHTDSTTRRPLVEVAGVDLRCIRQQL
jgi:hypothetical protein